MKTSKAFVKMLRHSIIAFLVACTGAIFEAEGSIGPFGGNITSLVVLV